MSVCKDTLIAVKENYDARIEKYINSLYNKSFEEVTDPENPMHKVGNIKFLNVKRRVNSETEFDIEINREGYNKLILRETKRIERQEEVDENIIPPLPPASMLPGQPSNNNKYNYAVTLQQKVNLKDYLDTRINLLKNEQLKENTSKEQLKQIAVLKELSINLFKEIKILKDNAKDLDSFIDNTNIDIENLLLLMKNPTLENLELGKKYIDIIDNFVSSKEEGFLDIAYTDLKTKRPLIYDKITQAREKLLDAKKLYEDGVEKILLERVEHYLRQQEDFKNSEDSVIEEEAKRLIKNQLEKSQGKNFDFISKFFTRIENQEEKQVVVSTAKKAYDDAIRNNGKKGVEDKLLSLENKIKNRLKTLGHTTGNFLNSKISWDVFKATEGQRLIGVFNLKWQQFKKANKKQQENISRLFYSFTAENSDAQLNTIDKHYEKLKKEADFIDIRKLPEIVTDSNFSEFSNSFSMQSEANSYKQELIDRIGNREYNKLIKEVQDNLNAFMIEKEVRLNHLFEEYGVDNVNDLQDKLFNEGKEKVWNFYLQEYYTKSPFIFAENHFDNLKGNKITKRFYLRDTNGILQLAENNQQRANLVYTSFIPKDKYKDKKYEENIKNDDTLREAWELMDELVEYSNQNGNHIRDEKSLDSDLGSVDYKNHLLADILGLISPTALRFIKKQLNLKEKARVEKSNYLKTILSDKKRYLNAVSSKIARPFSGKGWESEIDGKNVSGQRISIEQKVEKQYQDLIKIDRKKEENLSDNEKEYYRSKAYDYVMEYQDEANLIHNIVTSSQIAGKFKAKKEVESLMNFLLNQIKNIPSKKDFYDILELFINKNLYGINNRGKTVEGKYRLQNKNIKYYPEERAKIRIEIKEGIKQTKKALKEDPSNKNLIQSLEDLEAMKEDGVLYVNGRDVSEAVFFKIKAFAAFAINGSAQVTNMAIASANAYEVDGRKDFWKAGMYTRSMSFARKWKNSKYLSNNKMQEQRRIMDLFLKSANLVQNSANEIYKEQTSRYGSAVKEVIKNPINFVGEVEKTIQKPQLLALLTDVYIKNEKDGKEYPIFDAKNGLFPTFETVEGVLKLKDGFNTEHNRKTFLSFNTQEAANLFGESGKIPKAIAYINGDYRDSTTYLAEKYMITAMALMFKRWAVATIYKKAGIYKRLAKNDQNTAAIGYQLLKGSVFAASVGSAGIIAGVSMPMVLAGAIGVYAIKNRQSLIQILKNDEKQMEKIYKNVKEAELGLTLNKFLNGGATVAAMSISTIAHTLLNMPSRFIGRDVINSDKLKNISTKWMNKENLTEEAVEEIKEDLWFLQVSTSLVLRNMIYAAMLHSLYSLIDADWEDEEEKEKFKERVKNEDGIYFGENTRIDTIKDYPMLSTYYALNNMLSSFTDDVSMTENVGGLKRMGQVSTPEDVYNIGEALITGAEYKKSGPGYEAGDSKFVNLSKRYVVPSSVNVLGFGSKMKRDYNKKGVVDQYFLSNFEKLQDIQAQYKMEAKKVKEEELKNDPEYEALNNTEEEKIAWIKKKLTQFSREEYPSLNLDDFYNDGTLTDEGMIKIRNYEDKLPKKLKSKISN